MPPISSKSAPRLIISAGLNGSGSTWVFNVIAEALRRADPAVRVQTVYSDAFEDDVSAHDADTLVIKTHRPPPVARALARIVRIPIILTVRDPKDGMASLITRFGLDFQHGLKDLLASADALAPLAETPGVLTLRYEDGFIRDRSTVDRIAAALNLTLTRKESGAIWRALTPKAVRATIDKLAAEGVFADVPAAQTFDVRTHWHPSHVGDGRVGSWRKVLSARQAAEVDERASAFRAAFGYGAGEVFDAGDGGVGAADDVSTECPVGDAPASPLAAPIETSPNRRSNDVLSVKLRELDSLWRARFEEMERLSEELGSTSLGLTEVTGTAAAGASAPQDAPIARSTKRARKPI